MKGSNSTLKQSGFIPVDGKLVWSEVHHHQLEETGVVYVTRAPQNDQEEESEHLIYKLTKIPFDKGQPEPAKPFFWAALWNTGTHSGHQVRRGAWTSTYATIEEAVQTKLDTGYPVRMLSFTDLCPYGIKF